MMATRLGGIGAAVAVAIGAVALSGQASAGTIYVDSATQDYNQFVDISGSSYPVNDTYLAGQFGITTYADSSKSGPATVMPAWCVDINNDFFTGPVGFTYNVVPLTGGTDLNAVTNNPSSSPQVHLSAAQNAEVIWLANFGNKVMANYATLGGNYGSEDDFSAAVQTAIWNTEYGSTYSGGSGSNVGSDVTKIGTVYSTTPSAFPVVDTPETLVYVSGDGGYTGQGLIVFVHKVPEPASLAMLATGLLAFGASRRRRRAL